MQCFHPIPAWRSATGKLVFTHRPGTGMGAGIEIPCGQCIGCKLEKSKQWATRCWHESQLHEHNIFANLTYAENKVSLDHRDFQLFMKRLRKRHPAISYMMSGEYGDREKRPHYHAIIFNLKLDDAKKYKLSPSGHQLYTSEELEQTWGLGFAPFGAVTFESAAYVARYVVKKITGDEAEKHYQRVDGDTGEIIQVVPEYSRMSRNPAIGKRWLEKYKTDVYPRDGVILRGLKLRPPRYYDQQLERTDPAMYENLKEQRRAKARKLQADNTKNRLRQKEEVAKAKLKLKPRRLE